MKWTLCFVATLALGCAARRSDIAHLQQRIDLLVAELEDTINDRADSEYERDRVSEMRQLQALSALDGYAGLAVEASMQASELRRRIESLRLIVEEINKDEQFSAHMDGTLSVAVESRIEYFESGQSELSNEAKAHIRDVLSAAVTRHNLRVIVEGHADADPVRPGGAYGNNWELSAARAASAAETFEQAGVPTDRIEIRAFSSGAPLIDGNDRRLAIRLVQYAANTGL